MSSSTTKLAAAYSSPASAPFELSTPLPDSADAATSVAAKTAYLSALRQATAALQGQINTELTTRMEEDKARDSAAAPSGSQGGKKYGAGADKVDEAAEEENYGEEVVEEE